MPSLWKAYKNQYRIVPLQQMSVLQPESNGQGKYRVMGKLSELLLTKFANPFLSPFFLFVSILLNLVKRARLPNCRILLTRHDFVTSPRLIASLGVPAIATLGVLHVRQHVNELFCGEAGIEPLLAPKNRYPTYWFFYSVALPLSYSPIFVKLYSCT